MHRHKTFVCNVLKSILGARRRYWHGLCFHHSLNGLRAKQNTCGLTRPSLAPRRMAPRAVAVLLCGTFLHAARLNSYDGSFCSLSVSGNRMRSSIASMAVVFLSAGLLPAAEATVGART